jgi:hypothetical protein
VWNIYPYADRDAAEILGSPIGRMHQGEKRDTYNPNPYGKETELHGRELLGEGLLCANGRTGRSPRSISENRKWKANDWISLNCSRMANNDSRL